MGGGSIENSFLSMRPLISAHRGAADIAHLPAVDYVEFDVRRTADGSYVVYHDGATPSGRLIKDLAYDDFTAELGAEALALDDVLRIAKGRTRLHIDLKEEGYEAEIVRIALAGFSADEFVITSLEDESIRSIKEQFPQVQAGLSLGRDVDGEPAWRRLRVRLRELFPGRRLKRCRADFVAAHRQLARIRLLRYCARTRIPIWVWTVDDEAEIAYFLNDPRVTAVITNRPDIALRLRATTNREGTG